MPRDGRVTVTSPIGNLPNEPKMHSRGWYLWREKRGSGAEPSGVAQRRVRALPAPENFPRSTHARGREKLSTISKADAKLATSLRKMGGMGGYGSGRYGGRPTSEACASFVLTTTLFARPGLRAGVKATFALTFSTSDERLPLTITLDTTGTTYRFLELSHAGRDRSASPQHYQVQLETSPQPFGGVRWWFLCPRTGRRCTRLYLPLGGHRFWSRQAWGLGYACQRETAQCRAQRQAIKTYRALSGEGNWRDGAPEKPKGMRWRTYDRLAARLDQYNAAFDAGWMVSVSRLLARSPTLKR